MRLRKHSIGIITLVLLVLFLTSCKRLKTGGESSFKVDVTILKSGEARFQELIDLKLTEKGPITRQLPIIGKTGNLLFPQRISAVELRQNGPGGKILKSRLRRGDYWYNIDILELPSEGNKLFLTYTLFYPLTFRKESATLCWNIPGFFWPLDVLSVDVTVTLPENVDKSKVKVENTLGFFDPLKGKTEISGNRVRWRSATNFKAAEAPLEISFIFPRGKINKNGGTSLMDEIKSQALWPFVIFIFFLLLGVLFRFLPPQMVVTGVKYSNFIFTPVLLIILIPPSMYWIWEAGFRGGDISDGSVTLFFNIFAIIYILFFAFRQFKGLKRWNMTSYYNQFALLPILSIVIFIPLPGIFIFILPGLTIFLFWFRKEISFQFGAGIHQVIEEVNTRGEATIEEISKAVSLKKEQLTIILERYTSLPLVADFSAGKLYSSEIVVLKKSLQVCPNCGGGFSSTAGQAKIECEYCGRQFTSKQEKFKPHKPVPVLVESISTFFKTIGISFFCGAVSVALIFAALELMAGNGFGSALSISGIFGFIIGGTGYFFLLLAKKIRQGNWYGLTTFFLVLGIPLIAPLIALFKLKGTLIKLHFNKYNPKLIGREVKSKGEICLSVLAKMWGTSYGESSEAAAYLAGNNIIDAVYDRGKGRLVDRNLYRKTTHERSCGVCGGMLGIIDGKIKCHFCGSEAAEKKD